MAADPYKPQTGTGSTSSSNSPVADPDGPVGHGVLLWLGEVSDFDGVVARAEQSMTTLVRPPHRNPPEGRGNGPGHREIWPRDPDAAKPNVTTSAGLLAAVATHRRPPPTCRFGWWRRVPLLYGTRRGLGPARVGAATPSTADHYRHQSRHITPPHTQLPPASTRHLSHRSPVATDPTLRNGPSAPSGAVRNSTRARRPSVVPNGGRPGHIHRSPRRRG